MKPWVQILLFSTLHFVVLMSLALHDIGQAFGQVLFGWGSDHGTYHSIRQFVEIILSFPLLWSMDNIHFSDDSLFTLALYPLNSLLWGDLLYIGFRYCFRLKRRNDENE